MGAKQHNMPAEWSTHRSTWTAWPADASLWLENLRPAQNEFADLCRAIGAGEALDILVRSPEEKAEAAALLANLPVRFHMIPYGDIWLRDTAPVFMRHPDGSLVASCFQFNGWGEKYILDHDAEVALNIAESCGLPIRRSPLVLEGGSVEIDGEGTCLTTRQCLLNPNRNGALTPLAVETAVKEALGVDKVLWLDQGLQNDHTDGHIDTLARFVAPATVVCMRTEDKDDPNFESLEKIYHDLCGFTDARGRRLEVMTVPSPGLVVDEDGRLMPASYLNFYIANHSVAVPTYGSAQDETAVAALAKFFPGRRTTGLSARAILSGGGAFHCITQQEPVCLKDQQ